MHSSIYNNMPFNMSLCNIFTIVPFFLSVCLAAHCPNGWLTHDESCYLIVRKLDNFSGAESFCKLALKSTLAEIDNVSENDFLKNTLAQLYGIKDNYWIGGYRLRMSSKGEWEWLSNQNIFNYSDWIPGQPDDTALNENCVEMRGEYHYRWNDRDCSSKSYFICERGQTKIDHDLFG